MRRSAEIPLPFPLPDGTVRILPVLRSARKTIAVELKGDGTLLVRAPFAVSDARIRQFLLEKEDWIRSHVEKQQSAFREAEQSGGLTEEELRGLFREALRDLPERVARFAPLVGVSWGRITIRNQRTRWGSCSSAGNLNFNCLLMLAPEAARDYVVVHELCHRLEMNHSPAFWAHVARVCPDYKTQKKWFRDHGPALMKRGAAAGWDPEP